MTKEWTAKEIEDAVKDAESQGGCPQVDEFVEAEDADMIIGKFEGKNVIWIPALDFAKLLKDARKAP